MSLFNDDRRYSDDPEEYLQWKYELERECRKEGMKPDEGDEEEGDEEEDDKG